MLLMVERLMSNLFSTLLKTSSNVPPSQIDTSLTAHAELKDKIQQINFVSMLNALSSTIHKRISCEIAYNALSGTDARRNNSITFQHAKKLFLGCKAGAHLSSFCFKLWRLSGLVASKPLNNLIKVMMDMARFVV
ncbi:hypothetical protein OIU74_001058 [Salix koriyanagi]|uniref:Sieve element occlusion N-terminal domain-containing protein n=1 Tax=Salix koriyanagi TaxID=2511006 RepID=A0A9Q0X0K3_9ROSI|nr:hypothetical protein OIU74_001058 [Salix koriyanagi]